MFLNVAAFEDSIVDQLAGTPLERPFTLHVFSGLVDTGAQATCITSAVAEKVGLTPIGKVPIMGVSGLSYHNNYLFKVGFAFGQPGATEVNMASVHIFDLPIQGAELNIGSRNFDVLLGMDIINSGSLKIDGDGSFSFSF